MRESKVREGSGRAHKTCHVAVLVRGRLGGQSIHANSVESLQDGYAINDVTIVQGCTVITSGSMDGSLKLWKVEEEMELAGMLAVSADDKGVPKP